MAQMQKIKAYIRHLLVVGELPISFAAALAILILGEINFFSAQVRFQTEQMATFGGHFLDLSTALNLWI